MRRNDVHAPKTCRAGGRAIGNFCREQEISAGVMVNWVLGNTARERDDMAGQKPSSPQTERQDISTVKGERKD